MNNYKTLKSSGKAQKEFKNSIFIGYARHVKTETEAKAFINEIKKLHKDANHNVSAYLVKEEGSLTLKYDDDGEPAGSSGKPVFKVIESKGLHNTVVVMTRYFGGIKLGFGGLSRAYRETAVSAIEDAGAVEVFEEVRFRTRFGYPDLQKIRKLVEEYGRIEQEKYSDTVEFEFFIKKDFEEEFHEKLAKLTKNKIELEKV
ncbi:IMPACT family protein [Methanosarcina soligelidi]|uniref:IMPACT family protein n=1 Tax=Methanosarcina soligelidi TaxID=1036677 RepID=UPI00064F7647|nr:YigZ family protein [Methanosarcina soligelidi]